ncbi:MAG: DNA repair protein RecO [Firmicutes bacterium]|nr:DNA repair protein RecO [Bacillota bacterium]
MGNCKTRGIITRRANYGESNCMLTVLSEQFGVISACVYGVRGKKSSLKAGSQFLCLADFVLDKKNSDIYRVDGIDIIDTFYPITEDIEKLSLANYLCELASDAYIDRDKRVLSLLLNTLYTVAYRDTDIKNAKSVFELKLMQYAGYMPQTGRCAVCGGTENLDGFDISAGTVCRACKSGAAHISQSARAALEYILSADSKRAFSFSVSKQTRDELSVLAEAYFIYHSERQYKSLDYLKKILV